MTQFTSFVAVEEISVADGGTLRRIDVPVDVPEGMDRDILRGGGGAGGPTGLFSAYSVQKLNSLGYIMPSQPTPQTVTKSGGNVRTSGVGAGRVIPPPPNAPPTVSVTTDLPASTEEEKAARLRAKLQPTLLMVVQRIGQTQQPGNFNYGGFIRDGKAEVQLWLTNKSELTKAKLKELGFEVVLDHANSNLMIGRIPIHKLALLPELEFVRYVSPQISR